MKRISCLLLTLFTSLSLLAQGWPGGGPGSVPGAIIIQAGGGGGRGGRGGQNWQGPGGPGGQNAGFLTGRVWFLPEEASSKDGGTKSGKAAADTSAAAQPKEVPGVGTVVIVITAKKDTLYTTVGESGRFRIFNVPTGPAQVRFTMIGYGDEGHPMDITPGENKVVAYLRPASYQLDAAVKKADVPPVAVDKDTIIFRAAAVKVNKGEMAIDILAQMPGVEVTESSATVLNEEVKRVYVDGALLFGEAPMKALNNLPAEEVVDIRSYQEYANKDPYHKISENEEKERVLDVRTKNKPKGLINGDLLAGGGFDTDSTYHKFRYTTGVSINNFSESLQASLNFNLNNINDGSVRMRGNSFRVAGGGGGGSPDLRNLNVSASVNKRWMSPNVRNLALGSIGGSYSYSDTYNVNESLSDKIYFPSEKYQSRQEEQSSRSVSTGKSHNFSVNGHKYLRDGGISLNGGFSLSDNGSESYSSHYNRQDNLPRQGTSTLSETASRGKRYNASLGFRKRFKDKFGVNMNISGSGSDNDNGNLKTDSTTTTISHKVIDISTLGMSREWSVSPSVSWEIDSRRSLSAQFSYSDRFSRTERLAYDISDPLTSLMDTVNTYTHTTDNNTRTVRLNYRSYLKGIGAVFNASLNYNSVGINKHETFPEEDLYDHRFRSFRPSVFLTTQSMINNWSVSYSCNSSTPSVEQIRPRINNTNLYNVSAGNPNLRQSHTHNASLSYSTVLGAGRETVRAMESGQSLEEALAMQGILAAQAAGETASTEGTPAAGRETPGQAGNEVKADGTPGGAAVPGQAGSEGRPGATPGMRSGAGMTGGGTMGGGMSGRGMSGRGMTGRGGPQDLQSLAMFSANASFSMTRDPMVNRRTYFAAETWLPDYEYMMPAQSTFSSWENAPDSYSANGSLRLDLPIPKIRWMFNASVSFSWDSSPSYVNETLTRTRNYRPSVRIGLRSNFSRNFRIHLNGTGSYIYSNNSLQDATKYFTERLNVGWEVNNVFKHLYAGGNYGKSFTQGLPYDRVDDNIFDARAGARFGPRNNVDFSVSVHDLFNKTSGFSTSMTADYITNRRVHQFGRYVMFRLAYRFNSFQKAKPGNSGRPEKPVS